MNAMTVKELREILDQYPDDMPVKKYCYTGEYNNPRNDIEYGEAQTEDYRGREVAETLIL